MVPVMLALGLGRVSLYMALSVKNDFDHNTLYSVHHAIYLLIPLI